MGWRMGIGVGALCGVLAAGPAMAGDLAQAMKAGELTRAGELLARPDADPEDGQARCHLLLMQSRLDAAKACLRQRLAAAPDDKPTLSSLAIAQFRDGDFGASAESYAKAGRAVRAAEARALASSPDGAPAYRISVRRPVYTAAFVRREPLPILNVRLSDGRDHLFVLDTGGGETILDPEVATALGVTAVQGAATGRFAGDQTASIRFAVLPRLTLGDLTMTRVAVQLQSTKAFAQALGGTAVDGVIGVDLLRHFTATIDYPAGRLTLRAPGRRRPARGGQPFWIAEDHLLLAEARIAEAPVLALIDTGLAGQGCTAPASTLARIGVAAGGERHEGVGGGGAVSAQAFTAPSITLGDIQARNVPCLLGPFPPTLETSTGVHIGVLVSHTVLEPYAVTFDFAHMRMTERRPK